MVTDRAGTYVHYCIILKGNPSAVWQFVKNKNMQCVSMEERKMAYNLTFDIDTGLQLYNLV
jgi:hypothetical protein